MLGLDNYLVIPITRVHARVNYASKPVNYSGIYAPCTRSFLPDESGFEFCETIQKVPIELGSITQSLAYLWDGSSNECS